MHDVFNAHKLYEYFDDFETYYRKYDTKNLALWTQYGQGLITKDFLIVERFLHLLLEVGIDDSELALKMNAEYLDILATKKNLKPHARELLDFCQKHDLPITLVSNGFVEVQYRKLKSSGIEQYFAHVVLSEAAGTLKPDPAFFQYALDLNHAQPDEVLMIGDSFEADIKGAVQSGIDALFLNDRNAAVKIPTGVTEIKSLKEAIEIIADRNVI